ncbi:MAG TPA: phage baseplate assembly protein, partial [Myxococcota bacterium]|nr:phage baseplate assembly protein [Myxococcota bacterium]
WRQVEARIRSCAAAVARPLRGVVRAINSDGTASVGARAGEELPALEHGQHFGMASSPPAGTEVFAVPVGGSQNHLVVIAELDRQRPALNAGEVALYTQAGTKILLRPDGSLSINTSAGASIECDVAGTISLNGGTLPVARQSDAAAPGAAMTAWIAGVSAALATLTGGAFPPPADPSYTISAGAPTVRA